MKLKQLFKNLTVEVKGSKDVEITGICSDSKIICPGNLFIAKRGRSSDGNEFVLDACSAGAVAIVTDLYNPFIPKITQVIVENIDKVEEELASRYYGAPSKSLFLAGITGTNGKTTTAYLVHHLLSSKSLSCGLLGTIECIIGEQRLLSTLTTSDVITNSKRLKEMVDKGAKAAVMEVSSHALDQNRVAGLDFDAAIFTNFSQDHLDYHETMKKYLEAKQKLFQIISDPKKVAIVNIDDPFSKKIVESCEANIITYGTQKHADVHAKEIEMNLEGTRFKLCFQGKECLIKSPLIGLFNVSNVLAAITLALTLKVKPTQIQRKIQSFKGVPGRLEKIKNTKGVHLFVDFAHTEDSLNQMLKILSTIKTGRLITVFGCGGERDKGKRPKMAQVVEAFSDQMIVTSDNPRGEDPRQIASEIVKGFKTNKEALVELDRYQAIERAIFMAKKGDVVVIAGRGHELFQKIQGKQVPFIDSEIAFKVANSSSNL